MKVYIITAHYIEDTMWSKAFSSLEKCNEFIQKHFPDNIESPKYFSEEVSTIEVRPEFERYGWATWLFLTIDEIDNMELDE